MRNRLSRFIKISACLCALAPFLLRAQNNTQLGTFSVKLAGVTGYCDSTLTDSFLNGKWVYESASAVSLSGAGYFASLTGYNKSKAAYLRLKLTYNSANKVIREDTYVDFGTGLKNWGYVVADTNSSGWITTEHAYNLIPSKAEGERYIYTYSSKGMMLGRHKLTADSKGVLQESSIDSFTYNASGQLTSDSIYYFNTSTSKFSLNQRTTYTYYSSGKRYVELYESADPNTHVFGAQSRLTSYYDASNRKIRSFDELYRSGGWQGGGDDSISYDASSYATTLYYRYDAVAKKWTLKKKDYCANAVAVSKPAAPTNLTVTATKKTNDKKMQLNWTDNSNNESGFIVQRSTDNSNWTTIDSPIANATSFLDTGLAPGSLYYYKVSAWNSAGMSAFSNAVSATTYTFISSSRENEDNIRLFPNPSNGLVNLEFTNEFPAQADIMVSDITGKTVYFEKMPQDTRTMKLDIAHLPQGIYTLLIKSDKVLMIQKLVLSK